MQLEGIHHISCVTGDARKNLDFYTRVLGFRLAAKTVNQDDPFFYHLFYSDEEGDPGSDITFFEYPHAKRGRAGAGMIYRITWRVGSTDALDFWAKRLAKEGVETKRDGDRLRFSDPEGLGLEFVVNTSPDKPLTAYHPEIPKDLAPQGFDSVRAYSDNLNQTAVVLEDVLGAVLLDDTTWEIRGAQRVGLISYDEAPAESGKPGAGTVHHVAWGTTVEEHPKWLERLKSFGVRSTEIIDRYYFQSIYFREPSGVLYELADYGPGFARDSSIEELGKKLILPPKFENRRKEIEARVTPLPYPREGWEKKPA